MELGSVTTDGKLGSVTADGKLGSVTADGKLGSVTADGKLGSVTTDGKLGSVTADGKISAGLRSQCFVVNKHNSLFSAAQRNLWKKLKNATFGASLCVVLKLGHFGK
jgi:hypothetical protein